MVEMLKIDMTSAVCMKSWFHMFWFKNLSIWGNCRPLPARHWKPERKYSSSSFVSFAGRPNNVIKGSDDYDDMLRTFHWQKVELLPEVHGLQLSCLRSPASLSLSLSLPSWSLSQKCKLSQWKENLPAKAVALPATLLIGVQGQLILGVVHHLCHIISIVIGITYRYKYDIILTPRIRDSSSSVTKKPG